LSRPETGSTHGSVFTVPAAPRSPPNDVEVIMRALVERCCGLDVHQDTVVACLLIGEPGKPLRQEVRTWATTTRALEAMRDWLKAEKVTHVGMESTGVYWRPIYAVLEGHFVLIVGNARPIKTVPGRKTDVKDANWIADLVRHGLIRPTLCAASAPARVA
jgi:transposase